MTTTNAILSRRALLQILGAASAASLVTTGSRAWAACTLTPAQTEGPYWIDERLHRSDIRVDPSDGSTSAGVLLTLNINVLRADASCAPAAGLVVDVWHCDAGGLYSDESANGTVGRKFLRGYQVTDANGAVRFTTIYPGWYAGRTVHIHFRVRAFTGATTTFDFTSQLYFDDALTDQVMAIAPYSGRGTRTTTNANDDIYAAATQMTLVSDGDGGYVATHDVALNGIPSTSSATPAATTAATPVGTATPVPTVTPLPCAAVALADDAAAITVNTRRDAGYLSATLLVPLASYGGEAVTIALRDGNSSPIAIQGLGALAALGSSGKKWRFKSRGSGVQYVTLQNLGPRRAGVFKVTVRAKHWFTATAADQPAASTVLTVQIGTTCFTHAVTRKLS